MRTIYNYLIILTFIYGVVVTLPINNEMIKELDENQIENLNENSSIKISFDINNHNEIDLSYLGRLRFGTPDNQTTGPILSKYNINNKVNPEELGTYLEGDVLFPSSTEIGRNGLLSQTYRWLNGKIPFVIQGYFNSDELSKLREGFNEYHIKTCIRFIPRTTETDYISIVNGNSGCWSSIGKIGGRQEVNLQTPACLVRGSGTFVHELMHTVGFLHEQNRAERDDFVIIKYENINEKAVSNFAKASSETTSAFKVPYDYSSIMHYSANAFSSNGQPTIVPKYPANSMGQRNGFSEFDIQKINQMYNCNENHQNLTLEIANSAASNNNVSISSSFLNLLGLCKFFSC